MKQLFKNEPTEEKSVEKTNNFINPDKDNLLIIGTGGYAAAIKEIAENMGCFLKISFLDNRFGEEGFTPAENVIGKIENISEYASLYRYAIPSFSDGKKRLNCIKELEENCFQIPVIVSPSAYASKSAQIQKGAVIEAHSSIHQNAAVSVGAYISSGAVIGNASFVGDACFVGANAVVEANSLVPMQTRIKDKDIFTKEASLNFLNEAQNNSENKPATNDEQICRSCAEGAYWLRLDSSEVVCPKISLLHNGKCSAYRKIK